MALTLTLKLTLTPTAAMWDTACAVIFSTLAERHRPHHAPADSDDDDNYSHELNPDGTPSDTAIIIDLVKIIFCIHSYTLDKIKFCIHSYTLDLGTFTCLIH